MCMMCASPLTCFPVSKNICYDITKEKISSRLSMSCIHQGQDPAMDADRVHQVYLVRPAVCPAGSQPVQRSPVDHVLAHPSQERLPVLSPRRDYFSTVHILHKAWCPYVRMCAAHTLPDDRHTGSVAAARGTTTELQRRTDTSYTGGRQPHVRAVSLHILYVPHM